MKTSKAAKILLPAIVLLFGIALIVWYFASHGGPYSAYTGRTTGTVLSCRQTHWASGEDDSDEYQLEISYTAEGKEYNHPDLKTIREYTAGDPIELAYLPENPQLVVMKSAVEDSYFMVIVGVLLILFSIGAFLAGQKSST